MKSVLLKKKKKRTRRSFGWKKGRNVFLSPLPERRSGRNGLERFTVEVEATHESNSGLSILCTTFSLALLASVYGARDCFRVSFGVLGWYKVAGALETSRPMLTA